MATLPIAASRRGSQCLEPGTLPAAGRPTASGASFLIMLCSVLGVFLAQPCAAQVATGTVTVIVNQDNPVENLSLAELRDILSGQRGYWSAGRPVSLLVMPGPGPPERRTVLSVVLGMNEAWHKKHRVVRAESASEPITADSPEAAAQAVARTRGAIGLVAQAVPNVKVVRINGALPGDAAYPLRLAVDVTADVKVIANPSMSASEISFEDLKAVFLGTKTTVAGSQVEPVLAKTGRAHDVFLKTYLGKSDETLTTYYRGLVFTGKASMPKSFDSDAEIVAYVARTKGAIGY